MARQIKNVLVGDGLFREYRFLAIESLLTGMGGKVISHDPYPHGTANGEQYYEWNAIFDTEEAAKEAGRVLDEARI